MLNQKDMTEMAKPFFRGVKRQTSYGWEDCQNIYLSPEHCQLLLTLLVMGGLSDYQFGYYKRLQ